MFYPTRHSLTIRRYHDGVKPTRVLIIDDHRDSAVMLAAVLRLRSRDLAVDVAYDGESGLALALQERHDVVLVDLNLPGIDGAEVATQIRGRWPGAAPVLIALSGNLAEVARHQSSGVFDHAHTKPVNVAHLLQILGTTE